MKFMLFHDMGVFEVFFKHISTVTIVLTPGKTMVLIGP